MLPTVYLITIQQTVSKPQREIRNMSRIQRIETILTEKCAPSHLSVHNFSHEHKGPADAQTHMKVVIVSGQFVGKSKIARHQMIYGALQAELETGLHALQIHAYTEEEMQVANIEPPPRCRGGG